MIRRSVAATRVVMFQRAACRGWLTAPTTAWRFAATSTSSPKSAGEIESDVSTNAASPLRRAQEDPKRHEHHRATGTSDRLKVDTTAAPASHGCFAERLSASVDRPDVFDLSKVFFKAPVAESPCALCVFSDQQGGPLLPMRSESTKLPDASKFVGNEKFTSWVNEAVPSVNVNSAIALYGDSGSGKTMLATWGSQCPVLYFEGMLHADAGYDWGVQESNDSVQEGCRAKYTAALVLLQIAAKLAELGILEAPRTKGELSDASALAKSPESRKELSAFADRVFSELKDLKQTCLLEQQDKIALVFDDLGAHPTFARCVRDGVRHIRPLLVRWLNVKRLIVVISGTGLRLDPPPIFKRTHPAYLPCITTVSPTLTFEGLLPASDLQRMNECLASDPQPRCEYGAVLSNARLAVLTAAQVTAAFQSGTAVDLKSTLRAAMVEFGNINGLSSASSETKSHASVVAVALLLFHQEESVLQHLLESDETKAMVQKVCCGFGIVSDLRDHKTFAWWDHGSFTVSPAQWLQILNNYGVVSGDEQQQRSGASMSDVVALTLKAAVCAGASIHQWLRGFWRLLTDKCAVRDCDEYGVAVSRFPFIDGFYSPLEGSVVTQRAVSRLLPVSAPTTDTMAAAHREVSQGKIVVLTNAEGAASADIIVFFPKAKHVVLHLTTSSAFDINQVYANMGSVLHAARWHAHNLKEIEARTQAVSEATKAMDEVQGKKCKGAAVEALEDAAQGLKAAEAAARESAATVEALKTKSFLGPDKVLYSVIATSPRASPTEEELRWLEAPCVATRTVLFADPDPSPTATNDRALETSCARFLVQRCFGHGCSTLR